MWGEEAVRHLPKGRHLVVPDAHIVWGDCVDQISKEFLERASVSQLNTSCIDGIGLPPFYIPR